MEFFPGIVAKARTIDVLVNGMAGRSESLVLVQHLDRRCSFLRTRRTIEASAAA
jgi:hypothetical protein